MNSAVHRRIFLATASATAFAPKLLGGVNPKTPLSLPIKIGQIGTQHSHAAGKWETMNRFPDLFQVVGIVEPDAEQRARAQQQRAYRNANWISEAQLFEQASAVAIETDVPELVGTARRAVAAGKHLHMDKPGGVNLVDFSALLGEAEKNQLVIQMGYMFRYNPAFEFLFDAMRQGWIGEVREVHGAIGKQAGKPIREDLSRYPGGGMFELACHLIDAVITVMGPPTKVHSFNRQTGGDSFVDNQLAVLEYPQAVTTIRCNHVDPFGGPRRQFAVVGTAGSVEIRPLEPPRLTLMIDRERGKYRQGTHQLTFATAGRYDGDFQDLAAVLSGQKEFAWDYAHDRAVQTAVLEASGMAVKQK